MRIAVARERSAGETRVALVPDAVPRLTALGAEVLLEPGAGERAGFADAAYIAAGAVVDPDALARADLVLGVKPLHEARTGVVVVTLAPTRVPAVTAYAMDQVPRISRAQPMDALTSQALVAGYRAVVVAAELLPRFFPLSVTAAGTIAPAEVLVLGAGVAGLQAIATARRLGAQVHGYDVRASSAEEIASLGATAIDLGLPALEGAAGYAREMTAERAVQQQDLLAPYVAAADVVITTAAVPGRRSPVLVTSSMLAAMRPGSVVVDVAAESGGNVEGVVAGGTSLVDGITLWGGLNVPGQMPAVASGLYAQNVVAFVELLLRDADDEIVVGARVR